MIILLFKCKGEMKKHSLRSVLTNYFWNKLDCLERPRQVAVDAVPALFTLISQAHDLEHDIAGYIAYQFMIVHVATEAQRFAHGHIVWSANIPVPDLFLAIYN